jgi:hypothetical protein
MANRHESSQRAIARSVIPLSDNSSIGTVTAAGRWGHRFTPLSFLSDATRWRRRRSRWPLADAARGERGGAAPASGRWERRGGAGARSAFAKSVVEVAHPLPPPRRRRRRDHPGGCEREVAVGGSSLPSSRVSCLQGCAVSEMSAPTPSRLTALLRIDVADEPAA